MSNRKYSPELVVAVCRLARDGHTLTAIAARPELPDKATLYKWMKRRPEFALRYDEACAGRSRVLRRHRSRPADGPVHALVYSAATVKLICGHLLAGRSMSEVARMPGMPPTPTLWLWLRRHPEFRRQYDTACEIRDEILADEIVEIADTCLDGESDTPAGVRLALARLQMDVRRWRLGTLTRVGRPRSVGTGRGTSQP